MRNTLRLGIIFSSVLLLPAMAQSSQKDIIATPDGDLIINVIGHASLMFAFGGKIIHVDPVSAQGDYASMPKADLILVTHEHGDHLDPEAIAKIRTDKTEVVTTEACKPSVSGAVAMKNGETNPVAGLEIEAVPAYNVDPSRPFHPKGVGNGYVVTMGGKRVYVAGDTEDTPEMKSLQGIDVAFLPMNMPFTMTPEMVAEAAKAFRPKILYPYHYGGTDTSELLKLLEGEGIEIRIRNMR